MANEALHAGGVDEKSNLLFVVQERRAFSQQSTTNYFNSTQLKFNTTLWSVDQIAQLMPINHTVESIKQNTINTRIHRVTVT